MTPQKEEMSERNQVTITLSDKALEEYRLVAEWKNQPLASLLREVLETEHRSPSFASLLRRAKGRTGTKGDRSDED
jgi:hypothetical protein